MEKLLEREETIIRQKPSNWKLILYNDDFISFEYVIHAMIHVFDKNMDDAISITGAAHLNGTAIIGIYSEDKARKKLDELERMNKKSGYDLYVGMEEA